MYTIVIFFESEDIDCINSILNELPIKHQKNGGLVFTTVSKPWMDYSHVTYDEMLSLFDYVEKIEFKNRKPMTIKIRKEY